MHLREPRAFGFFTLALATALAGLPLSTHAQPAVAPNLCAPSQQVMFHCSFEGGKSVALCADKQGDRITGLGYRYGRPGRVELAQQAAPSAAKAFTANVVPLAPGASVRQLSFTRSGVTYLLMQCVGGNCPSQAGLAVLRGERVVSSRACLRSPAMTGPGCRRSWCSSAAMRSAAER